MKNIGFIGMGNMAKAIADGFISSGAFKPDTVFAYAPHTDKLDDNAAKIGFNPEHSLSALAEKCDTLFMACKPYQIDEVLDQITPFLKEKTIISIALGWDHKKYLEALTARNITVSPQKGVRVQFVMPNTPAQIGEGVFLFEETHSLREDERMQVMGAFSRLGIVRELPTRLMGIGGAITGCGPAFIDLYIEAMADAAVKYGIPRAMSYELVSATVKGSAALQLKTGTHPGVLKDAVCSPGGSTIRGVAALEENGMRDACIKAIDAVMQG